MKNDDGTKRRNDEKCMNVKVFIFLSLRLPLVRFLCLAIPTTNSSLTLYVTKNCIINYFSPHCSSIKVSTTKNAGVPTEQTNPHLSDLINHLFPKKKQIHYLYV